MTPPITGIMNEPESSCTTDVVVPWMERDNARDGGFGHTWAAIPWAEQAARITTENKESMNVELRLNAASTAE